MKMTGHRDIEMVVAHDSNGHSHLSDNEIGDTESLIERAEVKPAPPVEAISFWAQAGWLLFWMAK
jgi:hypothetical protein